MARCSPNLRFWTILIVLKNENSLYRSAPYSSTPGLDRSRRTTRGWLLNSKRRRPSPAHRVALNSRSELLVDFENSRWSNCRISREAQETVKWLPWKTFSGSPFPGPNTNRLPLLKFGIFGFIESAITQANSGALNMLKMFLAFPQVDVVRIAANLERFLSAVAMNGSFDKACSKNVLAQQRNNRIDFKWLKLLTWKRCGLLVFSKYYLDPERWTGNSEQLPNDWGELHRNHSAKRSPDSRIDF